ncbi:hypothetical protein MP228_008343 [Amoeboaphelidium protococcarum]|nr:hypothetical protein MP228_008343 [Amoeboaphelidium protococcarum]
MIYKVISFVCVLLMASLSHASGQEQQCTQFEYSHDLLIEYSTGKARFDNDGDFEQMAKKQRVNIDSKLDIIRYSNDQSKIYSLQMNDLRVNKNGMEEPHYPVVFSIDENGKIAQLYAGKSEPEWIANLKRGIVSSLQSDSRLAQQGHYSPPGEDYTVMEQDVTGENEYRYLVINSQVDHDEDSQMIYIQKSRHDNVSDTIDGNVSIWAAVDSTDMSVTSLTATSDYSQELDDLNSVDTQAELKLNLKRKQSVSLDLKCLEINCVIDFIRQKYSVPSDVEYVKIDIKLADLGDGEDPFDHLNLRVDDGFTMNYQEKREEVIRLARVIVKDGRNSSVEFFQLVQLLRSDKKLAQQCVDLIDRSDIQNVMVDVLIATGVEDTFRRVRDFILKDTSINDQPLVLRVLVALGYVPSHRDMLDFSLKIVENPQITLEIRKTAALSLGSSVRQIATQWKMYRYAWHCVWVLEQFLKKSSVDSDKIMYLHAIGNAGQKPSIPKIAPFINDGNADVVYAVIFSLRHMTGYGKNLLLTAFKRVDLSAELRIMALDFAAEHLNMKEIDAILTDNLKEENQVVKDYVWAKFGPASAEQVRSNPAWIELSNQTDVIGNEKLGTILGYKLTVHNPLQPADEHKVISNGETFVDVMAFKKRFNALRGVIRLQGDLMPQRDQQPVEAFMYIAIAGSVWDECIDLFGQACYKNRIPSQSAGAESKSLQQQAQFPFPRKFKQCHEVDRDLFNFNVVLFSVNFDVPLIVGIGLRLKQQFVANGYASASASGCLVPFKGQMHFNPTLSISALGEASINLFVVRSGARVNAKVVNADIKSSIEGNVTMMQPSLCTNVGFTQKAVDGAFQLFVQFRKIRWCQKPKRLPCGFPWGRERAWTKRFQLFKEKTKEFPQKCATLKFPWSRLNNDAAPLLTIQN